MNREVRTRMLDWFGVRELACLKPHEPLRERAVNGWVKLGYRDEVLPRCLSRFKETARIRAAEPPTDTLMAQHPVVDSLRQLTPRFIPWFIRFRNPGDPLALPQRSAFPGSAHRFGHHVGENQYAPVDEQSCVGIVGGLQRVLAGESWHLGEGGFGLPGVFLYKVDRLGLRCNEASEAARDGQVDSRLATAVSPGLASYGFSSLRAGTNTSRGGIKFRPIIAYRFSCDVPMMHPGSSLRPRHLTASGNRKHSVAQIRKPS